MTKLKWKYFISLLLFACHARSQEDTCSAGDPYFVDLEPDADIVVGGVLELHHPGQGVFGCGRPSKEGVQYYESLRWALNALNQKNGSLSGQPATDSFVPGVKFGMQIYDSCGHRDLGMRYMTDLFPIMKSGASSCEGQMDNSSSIIGMVDMTGILSDARVAETAGRYIIPVVPLRQENAVPPEQMAKVLAEVVHDMDWEKVSILHEDDEYSIFVAKVFSQIAKSGYPCITSIKSLPSSNDKKGADFKSYYKILQSFASKLTDKTGVIVIGEGRVLEMVIRAFGESQNSFSRLQWLFSWMPPFPKLQALGGALNKGRVYSLSPYPSEVAAFEDYWRRLADLASAANSSDRFFAEYVMSQKHCRIPGLSSGGAAYDNLVVCDNMILKEGPTDSLMRTARY